MIAQANSMSNAMEMITGGAKDRHIHGDVVIRNESDALALRNAASISGHLSIRCPGVSLPQLKTVGKQIHVAASGVVLPSLERVDGALTLSQWKDIELPKLKSVGGGVEIHEDSGRGLSIPTLEHVGGDVQIWARNMDFPSLAKIDGELKVNGKHANFPALTECGQLHASTTGEHYDAEGCCLPVLSKECFPEGNDGRARSRPR